MSFDFQGPNLRLDNTALDVMLNSTTGEVGRHMKWIGVQVLTGARAMVGVRTGRLKASLYMRHERTTRGQYVQVGSNVRHALVHHEGARPRVITPDSGRILRFNQGGRVIYARKVNHPGFRGRKYLTVPLRRAVRR